MAPVTLALAGDVMLGRGVEAALRTMQPDEPWGDVLPLLRGADLRIVNLECAVTASDTLWMRTPKVFHFRADPRDVAVLEAARIDACSLANNHTLDFEVRGLEDTLEHLHAAGIATAGAGADSSEAARPALLRAGDVTVGLVAFTDNEAPFAAGRRRPGTNYLPVTLRPSVLRRIGLAIGAAREAGARIVVVSAHWGPNMCLYPTPLFRAFARAVIDRGADVFHGHSAHVFQGIEVYRDRPILYDTGDFLDDYAVDPILRNDWSFLFVVAVDEHGLVDLALHPVVLSQARVERARGSAREAILDRMRRLSAELGLELRVHPGHLGLDHAPRGAGPRTAAGGV